jgi:hypothetical protein
MCRYWCNNCSSDWTATCVVKPKCKCKQLLWKYCHHCLPLVVKSDKEARLEWKVVLQLRTEKTDTTQEFASFTESFNTQKAATERFSDIYSIVDKSFSISVTAYDPLTQKWEEPIVTRPGIF